MGQGQSQATASDGLAETFRGPTMGRTAPVGLDVSRSSTLRSLGSSRSFQSRSSSASSARLRHSTDEHDCLSPGEDLRGVLRALDGMGLRGACKISVGFSFSVSNAQQQKGKRSARGRGLHAVHPRCKRLTPYEKVILRLRSSLGALATPGNVSGFGFGDDENLDRSCFPFFSGSRLCEDFDDLHRRYRFIANHVRLGKRSSIAPLIRNAVNEIRAEGGFTAHVLVIVSDSFYSRSPSQGKARVRESTSVNLLRQFSRKGSRIGNARSWEHADGAASEGTFRDDIERAIVEASWYPLSIIFVGVGDDSDGHLQKLGNMYSGRLSPSQKFDNFGFVGYGSSFSSMENSEVPFVHRVLQLVARQHATIQRLYRDMLCMHQNGGQIGPNPPSSVLGHLPKEVEEGDKSYKKRFSPLHAHINKSVTRIDSSGRADGDALQAIHDNVRSVWHGEAPPETPRKGGGLGWDNMACSPPSAPVLERVCFGETAALTHPSGDLSLESEGTLPPIFLCPITACLMEDPVIAEDGYTYEREAIKEWISQSSRSPMTNMVMREAKRLIPNHALRSAISEWSTKNRGGDNTM